MKTSRLISKFVFVFSIAAIFLSGCGESASQSRPEVTLKSIKLFPTTSTLTIGEEETLKAVGTYSDGTSKTIDQFMEWSSSASSKASVNKSKVTALAVGTSVITVKVGRVSAKATVNVEAAAIDSITVSPVTVNVAKGLSQQFAATAHRADGSSDDITTEVTWSSSDEAIATISNVDGFKGKAACLDVGIATITATLGSKSGEAVLGVTDAEVVSISVSPSTISISNGTTTQFTAMGTFTDGSLQDVTADVNWESSNDAVATISNDLGSEGLATSVSDGTVTITGSYDVGIDDTSSLTVTTSVLTSIDVTPANPSIAKGLTRQFTATGHFDDATTQDLTDVVTWSSSDTNVATIDANGLADSVVEGSTTITATMGMISGNTTLTITAPQLVSIDLSPLNSSIRNGTSTQFEAVGTYSDDSTQDLTTSVTWSSSVPGVATISNVGGSEGLATSVSAGATVITATSGLVSANTNLTVLNVNLVSIDITPAMPSIAMETSIHFTATGNFDDASTQDLTNQVTWSSSDTNIATISNSPLSKGHAHSVIDGSTTITALRGAISGNTTLTVTPATLVSIVVTPDGSSLVDGNDLQFTATGTFSDASVQDITEDVTWSSSDTNLATASNVDGSRGLISSVDAGSVTITATSGMIFDDAVLTVTAAELVSIDVTPTTNLTIGVGATKQFTATGTYTDDSTQDLTSTVTWDSSDTNIATIDANGLATAVSEGATTITATLGLISGDVALGVQTALDHVTITPTTSTLRKNKSRKLKGRAYYTDGSSADVTNNLLRWTSSNNAIIKINQNGTPGKVKAMTNSGTATITFTYSEGGITKSVTLDITATP